MAARYHHSTHKDVEIYWILSDSEQQEEKVAAGDIEGRLDREESKKARCL